MEWANQRERVRDVLVSMSACFRKQKLRNTSVLILTFSSLTLFEGFICLY